MPEPSDLAEPAPLPSLGAGARPGAWRDSIELRGLRFMGAHGALPEEAVRLQPFEVDLELIADLREAGRSDAPRALGYAQHGSAYTDIVSHYYPGTQLGAASVRSIRALVSDTKKLATVSSTTCGT